MIVPKENLIKENFMITIKRGGIPARDPNVIYYNGFFYQCYTTNESLHVSKSKTVKGLATAESVTVYVPPVGAPFGKEMWAPELHVIDDKCYIYVAGDDGNNFNHRMYVLYNDSNDPQAPYTMHGKMEESSDKWAIDQTVFSYEGKLYTAWSGWEGDENVKQDIYIAGMSDPLHISTDRVKISSPDLYWEQLGSSATSPKINEGPYALQKNGKLYIVYSGAGSWCNDYCLGMLTFKGGDLLCADNWEKSATPVFKKTDKVNGPGHASFAVDTPEGDWMFYHAFQDDDKGGWSKCNAIAQKFTWDNDRPVFGEPETDEE